jgi:hypothetical protein
LSHAPSAGQIGPTGAQQRTNNTIVFSDLSQNEWLSPCNKHIGT